MFDHAMSAKGKNSGPFLSLCLQKAHDAPMPSPQLMYSGIDSLTTHFSEPIVLQTSTHS